MTSGVGPGRNPRASKPKGTAKRKCEACNTQLSIYNPGQYCSVHQTPQLNRFRVADKRRTW